MVVAHEGAVRGHPVIERKPHGLIDQHIDTFGELGNLVTHASVAGDGNRPVRRVDAISHRVRTWLVTNLSRTHHNIATTPDLGRRIRDLERDQLEPRPSLPTSMRRPHLDVVLPAIEQRRDMSRRWTRRCNDRQRWCGIGAIHHPMGENNVSQTGEMIAVMVGDEHGTEIGDPNISTRQPLHR